MAYVGVGAGYNERREEMKIVKLSAAVLTLFALGACETIDGAGQDISSAGEAVSETARDVQDDI